MAKPVVLITGGAGFIGSHMVDVALDAGYIVRVVDNLSGGHERNLAHHSGNADLSFEKLDIRQIEAGHSIFSGVKYVIHLAGIGDIVPSIEQPIDYMNVNVQGTVRVLEAARAAAVSKLVYAASSSCYGLATTPTSENHPAAPQYPYALSKYQGEQAALHWHQVYDLPVNIIRIFNAYGTRVRTTGAYGAVFGVFFRQKLAGRPFTVVGDGTQKRDFVYASDVARAFLLAAQSNLSGQVWNLGADDPQSINRLVELIGGPVVYVPSRPGEPSVTHANIERIRRDLDWSQTVPFEEGVKRMMAEIELWKDAPLWTPDTIAEATTTWFKYMGEKH